MNLDQMAQRLRLKLPHLSQEQARLTIDLLLQVLQEELCYGAGEVNLFQIIKLRRDVMPARRNYNPHEQDYELLPPTYVLKTSVSPTLREAMNQWDPDDEIKKWTKAVEKNTASTKER